jgi:hypothetical protein
VLGGIVGGLLLAGVAEHLLLTWDMRGLPLDGLGALLMAESATSVDLGATTIGAFARLR